METRCVRLVGDGRDEAVYEEAGALIRAGRLVAFPTETVYGLGGNGLDPASSAAIYAAKGRPSDNPLILHIADLRDLPALTESIPPEALLLADHFWPGPMTLIFRKSSVVPYTVTGGLDTVAVRMPSHPAARAFLRAARVPVAAPSANRSGRPSTTTAERVLEDLDGRVDLILDGGPSEIGLESTIIDVSGDKPLILRPGYISEEAVRELLPETALDPAVLAPPEEGLRPRAPGMKYRHYAPRAKMTLIDGEERVAAAVIRARAQEALSRGLHAGVLCSEETERYYSGLETVTAGRRSRDITVAHRLFQALRELDDRGFDVVFSETFSRGPLGEAIMNRLRKAAGYRVEKVGGKQMIAIGCDHGGYVLKQTVMQHLRDRGLEVLDLGCYSEAMCDYPVYGRAVGEAVASGTCERGIVLCGTGIGISLAANRVPGIRAAVCTDTYTAQQTRRHNDANVLALGGRVVGDGLALKIVDTFLDTAFSGEERHLHRLQMMDAWEFAKAGEENG